jgi:hypothetical protein
MCYENTQIDNFKFKSSLKTTAIASHAVVFGVREAPFYQLHFVRWVHFSTDFFDLFSCLFLRAASLL